MKNKINEKQFYEELENKAKDIVEWIKQTESSTDACSSFIYELVTQLGESHFTIVGILTETLFNWRNKSNEVLKEE